MQTVHKKNPIWKKDLLKTLYNLSDSLELEFLLIAYTKIKYYLGHN